MDLNAAAIFADLPPWAQTLAGLALLLAAAAIANAILKRVVLRVVERALANFASVSREGDLDTLVRRLAHVVPTIVVSQGVVLVPHLPAAVITVTRNLASAFIVLTVVLALSAGLNLVNTVYQRRRNAANRPIKGYIQLAKIIAFGLGAVLMVAALMEQSPLLLLSGLGAMAAVLLLVFKDTILSLVASVQLTSNDMLRVGDWIEMPQLNADGLVVDMALHIVKVQNWDNTITTIPTHRLIAESYKNWRGMSDSGGRRIKRAIYLDQNSARFLTADDKRRLARFAALRPYLATKDAEIDRWNAQLDGRGEDPVNHRELTNIGTFRAYVQAYVENHPRIHKGMTLLVRQLEPGPEGLPIEIYAFTDTVAWADFEAIQGDIFDHLLAILPHFDLRLFQRPGGIDLRELPGLGGPGNRERLSRAG
jgi:miniconductance mechanosensitive channel